MSVRQQVLSIDNSIPRRERRVRWNHLVCPLTIPGGNVTVTERERDTYVGISVSDGDRNKGFRALGGNPPKG